MEGKIEHIQSSIDQKNAQRQSPANMKQVRFEDSPDQKLANSSLNNSVMPMTMTSEDVPTAFNQVIKNQNTQARVIPSLHQIRQRGRTVLQRQLHIQAAGTHNLKVMVSMGKMIIHIL